MDVVDYEKLDTGLLECIVNIHGYSPVYQTLMRMYYLTGCRDVELVSPEKWRINDGDEIVLATAKGQGLRKFNETDLPIDFVDALKNNDWLFSGITKGKAIYYYQRVSPLVGMYRGNKGVFLYAFRYRYVKYLRMSGLSYSEIKVIMGWESELMAERYSNAELWI